MLEQISPLWETFLKAQQQQQPLVLAVVIGTTGSSYKKPGAMMLIESDGTTHGLLSGGCLEADVAEHALMVFDHRQAMLLNYDLSDDSVFGLGAGCEGTLSILLLFLNQDYLPFSALCPRYGAAKAVRLNLACDTGDGATLGTYQISYPGTHHASEDNPSPATNTVTLDYAPPPKVAICGAGIDAIPLLNLLHMLHWHVQLIDHRPGMLSAAWIPSQISTLYSPANELAVNIKTKHDAVIIMSHNLSRDADYLQFFHSTKTPWIGLLGPPSRRDKVVNKAGLSATDLGTRLHAPIGLQLGGQMPENIAVSIVAELHQHFYQS